MIPEEAHSTLEIPVIDMHRLLSVESGTSELEKLHQSPCLQGMGILPGLFYFFIIQINS